jgi:sodium/bile acid cotransporter 7
MAGGNEATALVAVLGCTFTSWLVTPIWLASTTGSNVQLNPLRMMIDLALTLLVPVLIGQLFRLWPPARQLANERKTLLSAIAQLFVLAIVLKTAAQVGIRLKGGAAAVGVSNLALSGTLAMATHIAALFFGYYSAITLGFDRPRCIAIAFSGSQKTLPVSVYLFESYFEAAYPLAIIPLLFFHVGQLLFDSVVAHQWRYNSHRTEPRTLMSKMQEP